MNIEIVIATCNRPEPLRQCLSSLECQTTIPERVFIVDSSDNSDTRESVDSLHAQLSFPCTYRHTSLKSAAQQRNLGADLCTTDLILFLDDDVIVEPGFLHEILEIFQSAGENLAGVSGTISNQVYTHPRALNRILLGLCVGKLRGVYAGKVVGPAVNFLAEDGPNRLQAVEWLPSTCVTYRREVFMSHRFETTFEGYSFAEDLHLSARIAQTFDLAVATGARVFHADLGKDTHRDWRSLGESQVRNRWLIMTVVLGKNRLADKVRLFAYEMLYVPVAWLAGGVNRRRVRTLGQLLRGKLRGFLKVWRAAHLSERTT